MCELYSVCPSDYYFFYNTRGELFLLFNKQFQNEPIMEQESLNIIKSFLK